MKSTRVVHVNSSEWAATPEAERVYIGRRMPRQGFRASKWGNPYHVTIGTPAVKAVAFYRGYLAQRADLQDALPELQGKTLGCWCKKTGGEPCHGDILAELADALP